MAIALAIFLISLAGIVLLFAFKFWEVRRERVVAPALRARADERAQEFKTVLVRLRGEAEHFLPTLLRLFNGIIRIAALSAAGVARYIERELHRVADMVSHKRNFERRETQNDFLRQVSEHKNGKDNSESDTTAV
jgi:hypothetical protein